MILEYSELLMFVWGMKQCSYPHQDANARQPLSITPLSLIPSIPCSLPQLHPPQPAPLPHLSPLLWQVETLIDFLFSLLSSVHSLRRLPTYLALTEQCCSRRALKDRLDCLGIHIPHFFILLGLCVLIL